MFEGFTLRGRTRRHLYLGTQPMPWSRLFEVLLHLRGGAFEYGSWRFSIPYGLLYIMEQRKWSVDYMPPGGLKGKRVLDVGAGCGESCKFFLDNGVRSVYAVENNVEARRYLMRNSRLNRGLFVSALKTFTPRFHLQDPSAFDLVKMDIEGYELMFADWLDVHPEFNVDTVVEAHSVYVKDRFLKLGFRERTDPVFGSDPPWGLVSSARLMYRWKK
jgi:SAM-dependent methyltransferase